MNILFSLDHSIMDIVVNRTCNSITLIPKKSNYLLYAKPCDFATVLLFVVSLRSKNFTLQRFGPSTSLNFKLFFQLLAVIDSKGICSVLPCMDCMYVCCTARCRCLKVGLILERKRRLQFYKWRVTAPYKIGLIEA